MTKTWLSSMVEPIWETVTRKDPCPVCAAESDCQIHGEEAFVACRNVCSEWPLTTGGWLHRAQASSGRRAPSESGTYAMCDVRSTRKALAARAAKLELVRGDAR
jgi:hypothetical protein